MDLNLKNNRNTRIWLMKSEPDVFSFSDLEKRKNQKEQWDGVRNYQARNFMMKDMQVGDKVLFYHSNASPTGIAGLCEVIEEAKPDVTALDPNSEYYDPKATQEQPRWFAVTVGKPQKLNRFVSLVELREKKELKEMLLLRKGQRLSILPVTQHEYNCILTMASSRK
ncbi:EVE domain-containing protein [Fluviispira multicolorata]|uniref:EVE domain-containing protein n=1 Tax=Fluviispira multicolorata TaxID=2654512 RepID=A0A833JEU3_9BACT|nr:EVE domain-containing protein [Fluviispira multicolorata]KAB8032252.1 EVE domain-containing protein [Fluviispira multicolorata]